MLGAACFMDNPVATVGLLTVGLSLASFSYAGLYCNHQDMSPRYASILLGMTNTMVGRWSSSFVFSPLFELHRARNYFSRIRRRFVFLFRVVVYRVCVLYNSGRRVHVAFSVFVLWTLWRRERFPG